MHGGQGLNEHINPHAAHDGSRLLTPTIGASQQKTADRQPQTDMTSMSWMWQRDACTRHHLAAGRSAGGMPTAAVTLLHAGRATPEHKQERSMYAAEPHR